MIKSHAELEQWHYKAVRNNPDYRIQGLLEAYREEMSAELPYYYPPEKTNADELEALRDNITALEARIVELEMAKPIFTPKIRSEWG